MDTMTRLASLTAETTASLFPDAQGLPGAEELRRMAEEDTHGHFAPEEHAPDPVTSHGDPTPTGKVAAPARLRARTRAARRG